MSKLISFFCAFALLLSFSAQAADERFTVEIKVDVTDENASIAREKAMTNATRAAVTAVVRCGSTPDRRLHAFPPCHAQHNYILIKT